MENRKEGKEIRKSLAVDPATYDLLQSICDMEQRSKINQLKVLIQREHKRLYPKMNLFKKVADMPKKTKSVPQSYKPVLEAQEVIDLFSRLTLHQQAALMRLISRNLEVVVGEDRYMGYELDYEVVGAIIRASESLD